MELTFWWKKQTRFKKLENIEMLCKVGRMDGKKRREIQILGREAS